MALAIDWRQTRQRADNAPPRRRLPAGSRPAAALRAILAKKNDRLLTDAGLTREQALGAGAHFWQEWSRIREPWML